MTPPRPPPPLYSLERIEPEVSSRVRARSETLQSLSDLARAVAVVETKVEHVEMASVANANALTKMIEPRGTGLAWAGIGLTVLLAVVGAAVATGRYADRDEVMRYDSVQSDKIDTLRGENDALGRQVVELKTIVSGLDKRLDAIQAAQSAAARSTSRKR